jgi:predicted porin
MKKSLLALAVLGVFAGAASAQSTVTLYGLIDENAGKDIGSNNKRISQGASSRLGFRGVEDLGGGLAAFFQLEHRFRPWNGTINGGNGVNGSPVTFWQARSYVGLRGNFGEVRVGREYDAAFFHSELIFDPWGWDTVVSSLTVPANAGSGSANFNVNSSITYNSPNISGFTFSGQVAESNGNCGASGLNSTAITGGIVGTPVFGTCLKRPYSFGADYAGGPFRVGFGYNNPGNTTDKYTSFGGTWDFGVVKLWGQGGTGTTAANTKIKGYQLSITAPLGQGEARGAVISQTVAGVKTITGVGLGYHYALSKRTTLYTDFARNSKVITEKTAYDFGIKHAF